VTTPVVTAIRAWTVTGGGADYHDQAEGHWIDGPIATPMSRYPEYRAHRRSFGLNVLGTVAIEVDASDGSTGLGLTTGGVPAAWIVENHLARFVEGAPVDQIERIWDQMFRSTLFYGRRGLALNAISGVDLALYDLLGQIRQLPVHALIGGAVRDDITFYATGPRPDLAEQMGFLGAKVPLLVDNEGRPDVESATRWRDQVSDDMWLMLDCWMSLELESALEVSNQLATADFRWLEEPLLPDDYWAYAELRKRMPATVQLSTGEHEATRWGFRMLLEMGCADIIQPDIGWCGGLTELRRIAALADQHGALVVPHGSSVYSYHFVCTQAVSPFAEFLMMHPAGAEVVPMFSPLLLNEPVPQRGRLRISDQPGFGVQLNPNIALTRPFPRDDRSSS